MNNVNTNDKAKSIPIDLKVGLITSKTLIFFILLLPYIKLNNILFPYNTGRNYIFRVLSSIGFGLCCYLWFRYRSLVPKVNKISLAFATLFLVKIIAGFFSVDPYHSFWSDYLRMEGIISWMYLFAFYCLLKTVLKQKKDWLSLLKFSIVLASLSVVYILSKWAFNPSVELDRQTFTFGNPAFFGTHMLIHFGLALFILFQESKKKWRFLWVATFILTGIGLLLSGTRASIFGGAVFVVMTFCFYLFKKWSTRRKSRKLKIAVGALIIFLLALICTPKEILHQIPFVERITSTSIGQKEIQTRLTSWESGIKGWKEKPLIGWGDENFKYIYSKYMPDDNVDHLVDKAHNVLIEQLATNGIIGLLAYLILFILVLTGLLRTNSGHWPSFILATLWIGLLVQNQFIFETINSYLYFIIIIAIASQASNNKGSKNIIANHSPIKYLVGLFIIVLPIITWQVHDESYKSARATAQALETQKTDISNSFDFYKKALAVDNFGNLETVTFLLVNLNSYLQSDEFDSNEKLNMIDFALEISDKQLIKTPNDFRLLLLAGRFYYSVKDYKPQYEIKAQEIVGRAVKINPNRIEATMLMNQMRE